MDHGTTLNTVRRGDLTQALKYGRYTTSIKDELEAHQQCRSSHRKTQQAQLPMPISTLRVTVESTLNSRLCCYYGNMGSMAKPKSVRTATTLSQFTSASIDPAPAPKIRPNDAWSTSMSQHGAPRHLSWSTRHEATVRHCIHYANAGALKSINRRLLYEQDNFFVVKQIVRHLFVAYSKQQHCCSHVGDRERPLCKKY